jgi:GTPase SAR1 family protein
LGLNVKILLIGLSGAGKTQLIHSLLSADSNELSPPSGATAAAGGGGGGAGGASSSSSNNHHQQQQQQQLMQNRSSSRKERGLRVVDAFDGSTKRVEVSRGSVLGCDLTLIDTPGLHASASGYGRNQQVLQAIKGAYKKHKPDLVVYVDR